jgi:hypothetical protein
MRGGQAAALLYQQAIQVADLAVIADVLRRRGPVFDLVEVKATTAMKARHLADAAFQSLLLERARIPVGREGA